MVAADANGGFEMDTNEDSQDESRGAQRHRQLKNGIIVFNQQRGSVGCVIRDISDTGAKLRLNGPADLPHEFELVLLKERKIVPASLSWHNHPDCGVSFTGPMRPAPRLA